MGLIVNTDPLQFFSLKSLDVDLSTCKCGGTHLLQAQMENGLAKGSPSSPQDVRETICPVERIPGVSPVPKETQLLHDNRSIVTSTKMSELRVFHLIYFADTKLKRCRSP